MSIKGITKRWLLNSLSLIVLTLLLLIIVVSFIIRGYFYSEIQQSISEKSTEFVNMFDGYTNDANDFNNKVNKYVENFHGSETIELMAFDSNDNLIATSTGYIPYENENMPDYNEAKTSNNDYGKWVGKTSSGEKVMAVTINVYDNQHNYVGAVRYIASLEQASKTITMSICFMLAVVAIIIIFVIISSSYFIKSIIAPLTEIGVTAKKIAQGDFNSRIDKKYDDEIGELCDTINYMADELSVSEKMKNDFISSVSHELRTPLTAIKGWAETMQFCDEIDKPTMEKGMKIIVRESERLSGIVEELLDFSRMQSGRMTLLMDKMDVLAELDEAVYMLKERAVSENKHLVYEFASTVSPILGDKNRIKQVFINIIDNAIKYTQADGTICVSINQEDDFVKIIVDDNGCGIAEEHLPRIKEKFYKANQMQRGSGIGLAVADEIVTLHSGTLNIISKEGIGTTVIISIPIIKENDKSSDEN